MTTLQEPKVTRQSAQNQACRAHFLKHDATHYVTTPDESISRTVNASLLGTPARTSLGTEGDRPED